MARVEAQHDHERIKMIQWRGSLKIPRSKEPLFTSKTVFTCHTVVDWTFPCKITIFLQSSGSKGLTSTNSRLMIKWSRRQEILSTTNWCLKDKLIRESQAKSHHPLSIPQHRSLKGRHTINWKPVRWCTRSNKRWVRKIRLNLIHRHTIISTTFCSSKV